MPSPPRSRSLLNRHIRETLSSGLQQDFVQDERQNNRGYGTPREEITEEADYVNAPEGPADKKATRPVTSELSEDNAKQTAEILNLTSRIQELETRENLTVSCDNLTQAYTVSESNVKDLNAEIKTLTTQKDGLTKQIQEMETNWNELNVSRAQWSINEYCKQGEGMFRNH
ncbi:hypothetical protein NQZ68_020095 [Dissostichus eleginoides]|nr:hypothetical protein NQZ68_020095 [Dissostichus eleginoides]